MEENTNNEIGFDFDGMFIVNPYMDETDRFEVNPVEYYGATNFNKWKEETQRLKESKSKQ